MSSLHSNAYTRMRELLIEARQASGRTQAEVAIRLGVSQSFVSKYELGERRLDVIELLRITEVLNVDIHDLLRRVAAGEGFAPPVSILEEWELAVTELTRLVHENPSLRGMILGYAAEQKLQDGWLSSGSITYLGKPDDHDRQSKGDHVIEYRGHRFIIESKSLQTNTITRDGDTWHGKAQVDASDRRTLRLVDGTTLDTTLLMVGEFDVIAVNCFAFGQGWKFAFAKNKDLPRSRYKKYSEESREQLLASLVRVSWPPEPPFTDDLLVVLDGLIADRDLQEN